MSTANPLRSDALARLVAGLGDPGGAADLLAGVLDSLPQGIAVVTVDAALTVVYANPVYEQFAIPASRPLAGRGLLDAFPDAEEGELVPKLREVASTGVPASRRGVRIPAITAVVRPGEDVTLWDFDVVALRRSRPDGPGTVIVIATDVSDARRISSLHEERELRLRADVERAEELEQLKAEFLRVASHELRGPLAVTRGYLNMLEDGDFGQVEPTIERIHHILSAKAAEMNAIVDSMLEAARLDQGHVELSLREVDLRAVVADTVAVAREMLHADHEMLLEVPPEALPIVVDPRRIAVALSNLLQNSVKYSPEGGPVHVSVERSGASALIHVTDQGLGIDPEDIPRLFTRFGRIVTRQNSHIPGTGLGLHIAREVVTRHGGDIHVESTPGEGSTFTVELPLVTPAPAPAD